jgi:hypothetical protein
VVTGEFDAELVEGDAGLVSPAALRSSGSATAYPGSWLGSVVLVRGRTSSPAGAKPVEEVLFVAGGASSGLDQPPEAVAGYFVALLAAGLVRLGGLGITLGSVPTADAVQHVMLFQFAAAALRAAVVVPEPDRASVLAGDLADRGDQAGVGAAVGLPGAYRPLVHQAPVPQRGPPRAGCPAARTS